MPPFIVGLQDFSRVTFKQPGQSDEQQLVSEPMIHLIDRWERQFTQPPMQHLVEANFANQVKLLGYDLDSNRAEPGGGISVTLYWQGLDGKRLRHFYQVAGRRPHRSRRPRTPAVRSLKSGRYVKNSL